MNWPLVKLGEIAVVNPRRSPMERDDDAPTSSIPMDAVDDICGVIERRDVQPYRKVKKGYTQFQDGDVIFAKITPCMQNGKHAVVHGLIDGIGFGSTEFHVIRPSGRVLPEWIHFFLRRRETLDAATRTFTGAVGQQRVPPRFLEALEMPLAPLDDQHRIAARLKAQLAEVETARQAVKAQMREIQKLTDAIIFDSLRQGQPVRHSLGDVLEEIKQGIGKDWDEYPVLGATRTGLALAKEPPGKHPEKYKPVFPGTVFYNPMRILIGSIAFVDESDAAGITSPDYVALRGKANVVDSRWFYYWLRSPLGVACINSLARGAVRERMLFNRLAEGEIDLPGFAVQQRSSAALREIKPMRTAIERKLVEIDALPAKILALAFDSIGHHP